MINARQEKRSSALDFFRIRIVNFERRLKSGGLTLRLYRLRDLHILYPLFTSKILLEASGVKFKVFNSLFSFSKWLITTFQAVYVIEIEENGGHRIVGFSGIYNMKIGQSLWLSLTIFNPEDRRRGYGGKVLKLLLDSLRKNGAAQTVYAEVLKTNESSLRFLRKLGFEVCGQDENKFLLYGVSPLVAAPVFPERRSFL